MTNIEREKIHFVEYVQHRGLIKTVNISASIDVTNGTLRMGKPTIMSLNLEGKFIKFYYEPSKRIIGWKVRSQVRQEEMKSWKLVKKNKNPVYVFGIKGILSQFIPEVKKNCNKLEIHRYKEYGLLSDGEEILYVKIK